LYHDSRPGAYCQGLNADYSLWTGGLRPAIVAVMIGEELQAARKKVEISQEELAARAGIHRTYVSLLERNRKSPTLDVLFRVCKALGVRASVVIARVERKQK